jgi:hypothetical protein
LRDRIRQINFGKLAHCHIDCDFHRSDCMSIGLVNFVELPIWLSLQWPRDDPPAGEESRLKQARTNGLGVGVAASHLAAKKFFF